MFKVISTPEGFRIKEYDSKGSAVGIKPEVYATEGEALDAIKKPSKVEKPKKEATKRTTKKSK